MVPLRLQSERSCLCTVPMRQPFNVSLHSCGIFVLLIGVSFFSSKIRNLGVWDLETWFMLTFMQATVFSAHNSSISLGTLESIILSVSPLATFVCQAIKRGWQMATVISSCSRGAESSWQGYLDVFYFDLCEAILSCKTHSFSLWITCLFIFMALSSRKGLKKAQLTVIEHWWCCWSVPV